jgi:uncharacterized protein (TIGR03437 family)
MFVRCTLLAMILSGIATFGISATLVSQPGPHLGSVGLGGAASVAYAVGWSQTKTYSNVAVSAKLFYGGAFQGSTSGNFKAYLSTSTGTGAVAFATQSVAIPASVTTPATYMIFSGLTLGPGAYYLTIAAPDVLSNPGWATGSGSAILDSGVTSLGTRVSVNADLSAPYQAILSTSSAAVQFTVAEVPPLVSTSTLISQPGPRLGSVGLGGAAGVAYAVGWSQTKTYSNVAVSAKLFYGGAFQGSTSGNFKAYLSTSIGPGAVALATQSVAIPASATTPVSYTIFSGLTLTPGTYYVTIAAPDALSNPGWETGSESLMLDSGITPLGTRVSVNVDLSAPYQATLSMSPAAVQFTVEVPAPVATSAVVTSSNSPTISPNTWIEIHGTNMAQVANIWSNEDFSKGLPQTLDGVSATVNNKPAAVYFVSPNQINVLTPIDSATGPVPVQVKTASGNSTVLTPTLQPLTPAFLVINTQGHVAALHADNRLLGPAAISVPGYTFIPAKPGDIVQLYAVGFGQSNPPITDQLNGRGPLPSLPSVTIGAIPATVGFAGIVGAGLYQLNVTVPTNAPDGDLALLATYNGASTQQNVLISVRR